MKIISRKKIVIKETIIVEDKANTKLLKTKQEKVAQQVNDQAHPDSSVLNSKSKNAKRSNKSHKFKGGVHPNDSKALSASKAIQERHRHRYELNNDYRDKLMEAGMLVSGRNPKLDLVEVIELPDHPWFVGVQFHPEFKSRLSAAHPLFRDFVKASLENKKNVNIL